MFWTNLEISDKPTPKPEAEVVDIRTQEKCYSQKVL